ncbi:unnamed protein product, partial [Didymodactylos carnosus]
ELEQIEEQWRKEVDDLMALVSKLEDENKRLRDEIDKGGFNKSTELPSITREELECIKNLTEENVKLKRFIKTKDKDLTQKMLDMEAIQSQLERVCKINFTLRQKNTFSTNQTQRLLIEKSDLEVQLKDKENFINHMKERVVIQGTDDLASPVSSIDPLLELTDTNRPRFTLQELRQVLWERNDLKTKLLEVEEELRFFRDQEDELEGAVQGPINKEPEEKLLGYKREESKIRQFLRTMLPTFNPSSSSPPTSSVTPPLSKPKSTARRSSPTLLPSSIMKMPLTSSTHYNNSSSPLSPLPKKLTLEDIIIKKTTKSNHTNSDTPLLSRTVPSS